MLSLAVAIFLCPLCIMNDQREDVRKLASQPRPLDFLQWVERENEVLLTVYLTLCLTVHPHPMAPLKGL